MDEQFIIESFKYFTEYMDNKTRNIFRKVDRLAYYNILGSKYPWSHRVMKYNKNDIYKYSYKELYEQMCLLFNQLDCCDYSKIHEIISLKNFINYKMSKEVA